jgi:hypothetical protein
MQSYDSFLKAYLFFIRNHLDHDYVGKLDKEMERDPNNETHALIEHVKAIHSIRSTLTLKIKERLQNHPILDKLSNASGVIQYNHVPTHSTCIISGKKINPRDGVLVMIDDHIPCTVRSIYKPALYNYWFLIHLPEEIGHEIEQWLVEQMWWTRGTITSIENAIERINSHNNQMFAKKTFVKLKNINKYIQNELTSLPIN